MQYLLTEDEFEDLKQETKDAKSDTEAGLVLAKESYLFLLIIAPENERRRIQSILIRLREYIARHTGHNAEDVQRDFEDAAMIKKHENGRY